MIQRIQSLYLFISIVCLSIFYINITQPVSKHYFPQVIISQLKEISLFASLSSIFALLTCLLLYKKIYQQVKIGQLALFANTLLLLTLSGSIYFVSSESQSNALYLLLTLNIVAIVFNILAIKAIKKDISILRSVDRIR